MYNTFSVFLAVQMRELSLYSRTADMYVTVHHMKLVYAFARRLCIFVIFELLTLRACCISAGCVNSS